MPEVQRRTAVPPEFDAQFMRLAVAEAQKGVGLTSPNPLVGAVVVRDGKIIGRGYHARCGEAHAEVNALRSVFEQKLDARGATLYVTLEPCSTFGRTPPCTELIKSTMIARVVIGSLDPNPKHNGRAVKILSDAGIEVVSGVEKEACDALNRPFFHWVTTGKPLVLLKMAETIDGKIADAEGNSRYVSGTASRARVQHLRRCADAILVGAGTLKKDHPSLTARDAEGIPFPGHILRRFVASTTLDSATAGTYLADGGDIEAVDLSTAGKWQEFLLRLGRENVLLLLLEGGAELAGSAMKAGVVDLMEFHIAPKILGGAARGVFGDCGVAGIDAALPLEFLTVAPSGEDILVIARSRRKE